MNHCSRPGRSSMKRIRIETGSRLHLALLDMTGDLGRVDGGLGIALEQPRLVLEAQADDGISTNMYSDIVAPCVERLNEHFDLSAGMSIEVEEWLPQHVGLGSSTQVLLSVATAYAHINRLHATVRELASVLGRGGTSGIGVAAFEGGGFIMDAGHRFGPGMEKESFVPSRASSASPAPLVFRARLPRDWIIDVVIPQDFHGLSGQAEIDFFQEHCPVDPRETSRLARIVNSVIVPSVLEQNIATFIGGINFLATLGFKAAEIDNQSAPVIEILRSLKDITRENAAVGMSSFGPTLYAISTRHLRTRYLNELEDMVRSAQEVTPVLHIATNCRNQGAAVRVTTA